MKIPEGWRWTSDAEMEIAIRKLRYEIKPCFHCGILAVKDKDRLYRDRCHDCWKEAGIELRSIVDYEGGVHVLSTQTLIKDGPSTDVEA